MSAGGDVFGLVGERLDHKYAVEALVAEGGFGVVYRARHLSLKSPVALKVLKVPDGVDDGTRQEWMKLFAREAQTLARLDHPAIVRVIDFGTSTMPSGSRAPWMALEWIEGRTLADALDAARRALPPAEALARLRPVFAALACAHAAGVTHRDVKPSNVMCVASPGEGAALRLFDFGIAKVADAREGAAVNPSGETATRSALQAWSLPYAAPEQLSGTRTGPWTDVHALGLVLTELLLGRPAYPGGDAMALCVDVLSPERPTPARAGLDVGPWEPVLRRALALRPADRYADAGALLAALEARVPASTRPLGARSWRRVGALAAVAGVAASAAFALGRAPREAPARAEVRPVAAPVDAATRGVGAGVSAPEADAGLSAEAGVAAADVAPEAPQQFVAGARRRRAILHASRVDAATSARAEAPTVAPPAPPPTPAASPGRTLAPAE